MRRTFGFEWLRRCGALALALTCSVAAQAQTQSHGKVYYYYTDTLHSAVVETDAAGTVLERTYYAPFGSVLNRSLRNGPGYTGHEEDAATGLVYMQQRYYDPQAGRFISVDSVQVTANGGNFNRYWYAKDNPYRYTDPDGSNATEALGGFLVESWHLLHGKSFNGARVLGALKDGYNGEGDGARSAALQDAMTFVPIPGEKLALGVKLLGKVAKSTGKVIGRVISKIAEHAGAEKSFFDGTHYTQKVLAQMSRGAGEFHSFPEAVAAFEKDGAVRPITGGDGTIRNMLEIPGSYGNRDGTFQFIKEADGAINHRLFVPDPIQ